MCHLRGQRAFSKEGAALQPAARCAHRSRHCLPIRPGRCDEMNDHFFAPCSATSSRTLSSSSLRQGPLTRSGLSTCAQAPANINVPSVRRHHISALAYLLPAMQALDIGLVGEALRDFLPVATAMLLHHRPQLVVLRARTAARRGAVRLRLPATVVNSDGRSTPRLASSTTLSSPAPAHSAVPSFQPHNAHSISPPPPPPAAAAAAAAAPLRRIPGAVFRRALSNRRTQQSPTGGHSASSLIHSSNS